MNPQDPYTSPAPAPSPAYAAAPIADGQLVCEIKRHPIGIVGLYVAVGFLIVVLAVVIFVVAPGILTNFTRGQIFSIGALIFAVACLMGAGFVFVGHTIYWGNKWIVSDNSITQIKRISLFDKQTSQLSLANLEDITAEQDGLLAQMFHFGVISAETAAATDKFTFIYCPNPSQYVQQILAARERFEQSRNASQGGINPEQ